MEGVWWKEMSARQSQGKVAKVKMQKEHLLVRAQASQFNPFVYQGGIELYFSESPPTPSSSLVAVSFHKLQDVGEQSFGKSSRKFLLQGR